MQHRKADAAARTHGRRSSEHERSADAAARTHGRSADPAARTAEAGARSADAAARTHWKRCSTHARHSSTGARPTQQHARTTQHARTHGTAARAHGRRSCTHERAQRQHARPDRTRRRRLHARTHARTDAAAAGADCTGQRQQHARPYRTPSVDRLSAYRPVLHRRSVSSISDVYTREVGNNGRHHVLYYHRPYLDARRPTAPHLALSTLHLALGAWCLEGRTKGRKRPLALRKVNGHAAVRKCMNVRR